MKRSSRMDCSYRQTPVHALPIPNQCRKNCLFHLLINVTTPEQVSLYPCLQQCSLVSVRKHFLWEALYQQRCTPWDSQALCQKWCTSWNIKRLQDHSWLIIIKTKKQLCQQKKVSQRTIQKVGNWFVRQSDKSFLHSSKVSYRQLVTNFAELGKTLKSLYSYYSSCNYNPLTRTL